MPYKIPQLPLPIDLETKAILKAALSANKRLAELKGVVKTMPNETILIDTLALQEARDSSAIESIITTQDELYKAELMVKQFMTPAAKEVQSYAEALKSGFHLVSGKGLLTNNVIIEIYRHIKHNDAGFRSTPGTTLKNERTNEVVYEPPQTLDEIVGHMTNLEAFINNNELADIDPLIKMAVIHHQFESIHPFSDGNGRTGRIINILYLVQQGLLDLPVLYLSRFVISNKGEYYRLLQAVRDKGEWENWVLFMLKGVEQTALETTQLVGNTRALMQRYKNEIRNNLPKIYSQDLLNNLFRHPYTKIEFIMKELGVSRPTASSYLKQLEQRALIIKFKIGKENFYLNHNLYGLLETAFHLEAEPVDAIDSAG
jgi:Fic family protein